MKNTRLVLCLAIAASVSAARVSLAIHPADDSIPLANWVAPPYWVAPDSDTRSLESKHLMAPSNPPLAFHALTPCRITDTRGPAGPYGAPSMTANTPRSFVVTGVCGIPLTGVGAVSFNFAVVNMTANGNLVVYPTGSSAPSVSSLNWTPPEIAISNAAVVGLGSGSITVTANGPVASTTDLIFDVNGYYAADPVVSSLNGISGVVSLVPAGDVTITPAAPSVTIGTNAVSTNTPSTLVRRDASGNFSAGTITGTLNGTASSFTGSLAGDVTGAQGATVVSSVGGSSAASVHSAELIANAATAANTPNTVVRRNGTGAVSGAGYVQPGTGGETLKTIRGMFAGPTGAIFKGSGFTVTRNSTGSYTVIFQTFFADYPSLSVQTIDNLGMFVTVQVFGNASFTFSTLQPNGTPIDPFVVSFIAVGPV